MLQQINSNVKAKYLHQLQIIAGIIALHRDNDIVTNGTANISLTANIQ